MSQKPPIERVRIVGYVKPQLADRLQELAEREGIRSQSAMVDQALIEFERNRRPKP